MRILTWGIYLIAFCLPMYLVRFKVFSIPTTVLEILIYILFIIWLIRGFKFNKLKKLFTVHCSLFTAILLILIGVSVAMIFSWDLQVSAGIWKAWFIDPLLFFVIVISVVKPAASKSKQARPSKCEAFVGNILYAFILSAFVVGVISLVYLIQGKLDPTGRLQGFYNSPNYLAMYLAPALIISFCFLFFLKEDYLPRKPFAARAGMVSRRQSGRARARLSATPRWGVDACLWVNSLLLLVILFFTKSFGAWLGIIIALCFGLALYLYKSRKLRLLWLIISLGLAVVLLLICLKINVLPQGKASFNARLLIWQKAWQVFKTYPLIGIGPGTFEDYFPLYPKWGVPQPHSIYFAFLLQTGIIGFIGFIWLLIWFFRTGFKLFTARCFLFIVPLLVAMVYILAHGLVDTTYWKNDLSVFFWLIIGLMAILSRSPTLVGVEDPRFLNYKKSGEK